MAPPGVPWCEYAESLPGTVYQGSSAFWLSTGACAVHGATAVAAITILALRERWRQKIRQ